MCEGFRAELADTGVLEFSAVELNEGLELGIRDGVLGGGEDLGLVESHGFGRLVGSLGFEFGGRFGGGFAGDVRRHGGRMDR